MLLIPILIYIIILLLLFISKPSIMFNSNGIIKTYNENSLLTLDLIYPILAIISYYIYLIIKTIIKK
jgi:hypothetical protein